MNIIRTKNNDESSDVVFQIIKNLVAIKPDATIGFATGSSPVEVYKKMIADHKANGTTYKDITSFNLDEYVGLDETSDQSYIYFMKSNLFDHIDIKSENINIPNGMADDIVAECTRYSTKLANAKIDLQILGIGENGHIAFNEPMTPFDSLTHEVELTENTINANARFFENIQDVPRKALTMGIGEILGAGTIVLIASGKNKAQALADMQKCADPKCPASSLLLHDNVFIVADSDALPE